MKKLLTILVLCVVCVCCAVGFAACEDGKITIHDTPHTHAFVDFTVNPTCTAAGYTLHKCACGYEYKDTNVAATGHNYKWTTTKTPTETEQGEKQGVCTRCGDTITQSISKLSHTHNYTTTVINPTCTQKGYTLHKCACGDSYKDNYINATGHKFTKYVSDGNATYEKESTKTAYCDYGCGTTNTIIDSGSRLNKIESLSFNKTAIAVDITSTKTLQLTPVVSPSNASVKNLVWESSNTDNATVSGGTVTIKRYGSVVITATSPNGKKAECNIMAYHPSHFKYTVNQGKATITGYDYHIERYTIIVIPETINTFPITSIGEMAFFEVTTITKLFIVNNVNTIGKSAFNRCNSLNSVMIGNSVTSIEMSAFLGCSSLTSITIPDSVTSIGVNAFWGCRSLTSVKV